MKEQELKEKFSNLSATTAHLKDMFLSLPENQRASVFKWAIAASATVAVIWKLVDLGKAYIEKPVSPEPALQ
ncbi:MAG: hypothetical protein DU429_06810 [Candidatus Tokpelaia sp.]|nr:MAG: hypothetical protein DU430_07245 [Candidatus Tokpelaia sp.]KAA6206125.1 MAG: hypothetical protein DU429_06810 [Candidatus Tokpelaia sp.]